MAQDKTSQNFTSRLETLRAISGQQWDEVAKALGVTREHLYNYRKGKHAPPAHIIVRLEAAERSAGIGQEQSQSQTATSGASPPEPPVSSEEIMRWIEANDRVASGECLSDAERAEVARLGPMVKDWLDWRAALARIEQRLDRIEKKLGK